MVPLGIFKPGIQSDKDIDDHFKRTKLKPKYKFEIDADTGKTKKIMDRC